MNKPQVRTRSHVPFGGTFDLSNRDRGIVGRGINFNMLSQKVRDYRKANGLPIGLDLDSEIEQELCLKYPDECIETDSRVPPSGIRLTLDDVVTGTKTLFDFKMAGSPLVPKEEATRRASICATCKFQSDYTRPCSSCDTMKQVVTSLIGGEGTIHDDNLRACRVCHCFNAAQVWLPLEILNKNLSDEKRGQFDYVKSTGHPCWH